MSDLSLEQKAALLSGQDFWTTKQVGDVPAMVLVDGPWSCSPTAARWRTCCTEW